MAYRILYGSDVVWEPYSDSKDAVTDVELSMSVNAAKYLDFTMPPTHSLYNKIAERSSTVWVYADKKVIYKGFISNITTDIYGYKSVSCTSVMNYLGDTHVRDYSTISGEQTLTAPSTLNGLFQWYIDQHNSRCLDPKKKFKIGVNEADLLDPNNYVYRSSTQFPTTSEEIENKILDSGGYIFERYEGNDNILDIYADAHEANTQILDFGVNITDFTRETSTEDQYTAVYATGYTPDPPSNNPNKDMKPISLADIPNGTSKYGADLYKRGDVLYSVSAVQRYGYREYYYSNDDITNTDNLLRSAGIVLNKLLSPSLTLDVKAVDMALFSNNGYEHLQLGQAVRVRSKPHNTDEYLMISAINLDLQDPGNTSYTIGTSYDTLTGQQSSYLKSLNSGINSSLDAVGKLDSQTKKNALDTEEAKRRADEADKKAEQAKTDAATAGTKADKASQDATAAGTKADKASQDATAAGTKADKASQDATAAGEKAEQAKTDAATAGAKADKASQDAAEADKKAEQAKTDAATAIGSAKDAADKAASASQKADDNTAKITTVENTIKTISGDTATAIANAKKAQDAADAAKKAADQAQSDADTANTEIGKVQSQVGTINTEIGNIKQEATDLRDDLSGQITTVKNTMEADYTRKTELSDTTATLRNEISESAAGVIHTVSQDYATKKELKTTTDATNKNATDLTNAINKFNSDVDNLQGQIDGAIETWFYEVDPTDKNEPAVNWNTDTLKKTHLGDLYYNTVSGYCWRYQIQNGSYSWSRITDVDVTKALADAAAAQTTANSKKRIFVTTPNPPYDVGDLWTQGSAGDIMRCQTAKTSSQSYAAADWVKASKYTDDTAVTKLSNTVEKTYSTKTEVKQLSDQVSSTVSSLETVRISAEAAQTSADNAKKAADAAQTAADAAKDNAATAQSKADEAAKNLAAAEKNLETLQSQANATDEQLTAAKAEVEKAKTAAATAQSTADTAKSDAATAQATADTAKANAKTAQDDVDALKNRVTSAETSIKQNSDAIALRATKTEVTSAIDGISVGGRNLFYKTKETPVATKYEGRTDRNYNSWASVFGSGGSLTKTADGLKLVFGSDSNVSIQVPLAEFGNVENEETVTLSFTYRGNIPNFGDFYFIQKTGTNASNTRFPSLNSDGLWHKYSYTFSNSQANVRICVSCLLFYNNKQYDNSKWIEIKAGTLKLEKGNKATDWSPAPEDLVAESEKYIDELSIGSRNYIANSLLTQKYVTVESYDINTGLWVITNTNNWSGGVLLYKSKTLSKGVYSCKFGKNISRFLCTKKFGEDSTWIHNDYYSSLFDSGECYVVRVDDGDPLEGFTATEEFQFGLVIHDSIASEQVGPAKLELGNKPTDWSPAPEDLIAESKTYTDAQLKVSADSITSTVSKTYATKTDLSTTNSNVTKAQTAADDANTAASNAQSTANSASSAASKAQQTANDVTKNLANNYTNTVDMNSKIEQTANSIKTEVSKTYQPKGDYATNSSVQSAIEQSASSITSTVSKTYATKTSVDTLQNIADNAIESWYLVGVPSGKNKPASDWTTDTLKKQHVGDMYYDKDTGYSYRWLQEGTAYKWVQIKDNDITNANVVANEAKSTAKSAESAANTAKTTADNASATASAASTKANDAATNAATAKSDASTAKTTANAAKSTADNASKTANAAKNTANDAQTAADNVAKNLSTNYTTTVGMNSAIEQSANAIKQTVSETYQVKGDYQPAGDYATKNEMTTAIEQSASSINLSVSNTYATKTDLSTTNSNVTNAQKTANDAQTAADKAQTTANDAVNNFNNLSIGGRNYIANSLLTQKNLTVESYDLSTGLWTITNTNTWMGGILLYKTKSLPKGIYSCKFEKNIAAFVCTKRFGDENIWRHNDYYSSLFDSGDAYVVDKGLKGFTATEEFQFGLVIIGPIASEQVGPAKLELGNKPTDWSPAPEDIKSDADSVKNDLATNYVTTTKYESGIKVLKDSITSEVSKTYATSEEVKQLKNIADGAIETWSGTVDPTASNAPASSWDTPELKKQHSGDMYYNTTTGIGFRWTPNSAGTSYSWTQIRDTGVSKALQDAANAQSTANSATQGIEDINTNLTNNYVTNSKLTQTSDSITSTVAKTYQTISGMTDYAKTSEVNQTVNGIETRITTITTTANDAKTAATNAEKTANSANTAATAANKTASEAKTAASNAQTAATNSASSAATAASSASTAATKASNAETKAKEAATSASNANDSATSAATSASNAEKSASTASTNSTAAAKSASDAKTAADTAATKATNAASSASASALSASSAADSAKNAAADAASAKSTAQKMETLIRDTADGVEVAKLINGEYTSTKTLMGDDGFYVKDKDGINLTQIKGSQAIIGKENESHLNLSGNNFAMFSGDTPVMSLNSSRVSLRNGNFIFNTYKEGNFNYNNIEASDDLILQSCRNYPISDRCVFKTRRHAGAGHTYNDIEISANVSKENTLSGTGILISAAASNSGGDDKGHSSGVIVLDANSVDVRSHQGTSSLDVYGNASINGIPLITQTKWLWNGTSNPRYMSAEHTVTLSEKVTSQPNGIILCWCGYSGGKRQDYNFSYTFVPKMHVEKHPGCGLWCLVCDSQKGGWNGSAITSGVTAKYVYVNNNTITGYAGNHNSAVTNDVVNKIVLFGVLAV